jgi:hypothetical protein
VPPGEKVNRRQFLRDAGLIATGLASPLRSPRVPLEVLFDWMSFYLWQVREGHLLDQPHLLSPAVFWRLRDFLSVEDWPQYRYYRFEGQANRALERVQRGEG